MYKTPPQSKEAEWSLLSSLITDQNNYYLISGIITDESFYATKNQQIFQAITRLVKNNEPVDIVSLYSELEKMKVDITRSELVKVAGYSPTAVNVEHHAKIVAENYTRRQAVRSMQLAIQKIQDGFDITDIIATTQKELVQSIPQGSVSSDVYPAIFDTLEKLIDLPKGGVKNYIPTGFHKLDKEVKLTPGTLTLIAADPGVGKTSYLLSVARNIARQGKRALFFTLEMTKEQIYQNIIAQELGLCHRDMINGELSNEDNDRLVAGLKKFNNYSMGVLDGRWTVSKIRHQLITEKRTNGCDCLIVDALGDIENEGNVSNKSTHEIYNDNIQQLVRVGVELKIPVLLSHHLNKSEGRRGKNNKPTRHSLMQAGDKLSHNVILLYREYLETGEFELKDIVEAIIVKARDGEVGFVKLGFNGPCKLFYNIEEHREPPAVMAGARQWGN